MDLHTLQDLFPRLAAFGDAAALLAFEGEAQRSLSFRELAQQSEAIAAGLLAQGVKPGEPLALFAPNSVEWVLARLAMIRIGALCVPIDFDADAARLKRLLDHGGARRLFVAPHLLDLAERAVGELERAVEIVRLDEIAALAAAPGGTWPAAKPEDIVSRFYTSGTTGQPKAVPLTHRNIVTNLSILSALKLLRQGDRVLLPLPLHHSYPFIIGLLLPLVNGATVVLPASVTGPALMQALKEGEVAVLVGVPRLYAAMSAGIESRLKQAGLGARLLLRLSGFLRRRLGLRWGKRLLAPLHRRVGENLRLLVSGGAKLDEAVAWRLESLGYQVLQGYGLVETTSVAIFNPPGKAKLGSAGKAPPGIEVRIQPVPDMAEGEIQIKGPVVFHGYADNPEANAEAFTDDGWFRTGDLGRMDEDGYVTVTGRLKEVIVLAGGKKIEPAALEAAYADCPLIKELAVLERDGRLLALVVPDLEAAQKAGTADIETSIRVALGERGRDLPAYMRVADVALTRRELPRNHLGKYKRHQLDAIFDQAERGEVGGAETLSPEDEKRLATERGQRLMAFLEERFPDQSLTPGTSLQMELGIDSLAWIDFGLELEAALGVSLTEAEIARVVTLRDLLDAVEQAKEAGSAAAPSAESASEEARRWLEPGGVLAGIGGWLLYVLSWLWTHTYLRLSAKGAGNVPRRGPLIVVCNHQSDIDPVVVGTALPYRTLLNTWWGAEKSRVFASKLGRAVARAAHIFPVDDRAPAASLALAQEVLQRGRILVWFPESWRSPTEEILPFRPGVGLLIEKSGAPVLPAVVAGAIDVMPRNAHFPRPRKVRLRFGTAIANAELMQGLDDKEDRERHTAIAQRLREHVVELQEMEDGKGKT
ncbi:MAG TPA: AMP-binding protein [Kiloniellales bacterium]|nr:AMP-binding protein [Kiloniellales bacterium]